MISQKLDCSVDIIQCEIVKSSVTVRTKITAKSIPLIPEGRLIEYSLFKLWLHIISTMGYMKL